MRSQEQLLPNVPTGGEVSFFRVCQSMMNNNNQHNQDNQDNQHTDGNTNRDTNAMDSSRYASLLYSSRNAQRMITPKYLCNLSFILILGLKLTDGTTVPWPYVFVALFLSNNSSFYVKFQEFAYFLTNGEYMVGLGRQLASFVDLIGSFVAKIALCSYLSTFDSNLNTFNGNDSSGGNSGDDYSGDAGDGSDAGNSINSHNNSTSSASNNRVSSSLTFLLLPLWISLLVSVFIRYCCKNFPIDSTDSNRFSISSMESYGTTLVFVVTRGLQPLLISLKVDKVLDINWFFVLGPLYSLAFIGLSIAILMVSFAPFIHITSSSQLRHQALGLVHVVALQIAIVSLCVIVFLVLLCKRIELSHNLDSSTSNNVDQRSPFDILSPLLIMFTLLIITNPLLMAYSQRYQVLFKITRQLYY